jgi:hypothetical protein
MTLITGQPSYINQRMHLLIVEVALAGPVKLLICGNRYNHYGVNYALAATTGDFKRILDENILLSRAETCYQMVELLHKVQADSTPSLALDFLNTFYEKSIPEREIDQLLFEALLQLRRLNQQAAVIISAHSGQRRPRLLKALESAVDWVESPRFEP